MSEPKLVSPLLDGFIMGDPISEHNGIRCCPAMDTANNNRYIVKIISLPASQTQLDALLLTKAFENEEDAAKYYASRAREVVDEINVLNTLSRQEGFISYLGHQIVPMDNAVGYDVYILSEYKRSLVRQFTKKPTTHLDALNLGLDICSALTAARRNGYLFVNLKPSNIYLCENGEYKIGDLGFIALNALKYTPMPEHYIGAYTPPEITDAFSSIPESIDVYSLGMILYQIFNGGELPDLTAESLPSPQYADDEMSEIILKACAASAEDRWTDPAQLGHMLVSYMQKNGASDTPIVPILPEIEDPAEQEDAPVEVQVDTQDDITEDNPASEDASTEEIISNTDDSAMIEDSLVIPTVNDEELPPENETLKDEAFTDASTVDDLVLADISDSVALNDGVISDESIDSYVDKEFDSETILYDDVSEEVSEILAQADQLAAIEVPEPVVAPDPIEIVIPEPTPAESDIEQDIEEGPETPFDPGQTESIEEIKRLLNEDYSSEEPDTEEEYSQDYADDQPQPPKKKKTGKVIVILLLVLAALIGGFLFYRFYVLKTIDDLTLTGSRDHLTVSITSEADESILSIICTDIYGKPVAVPVTNGTAEFSGLLADTEYTITVDIDGLHMLDGKTTATYFTPKESKVVQYSVVTGNTEGSAILSFTVDGPDSAEWIFIYSTDGEAEQTTTFTGHTVTLNDLIDSKIYTGKLIPVSDLFITEEFEITFTASDVIQASNLMITSCKDNTLIAKWTAPDTVEVSEWTVCCSNGSDYNKTMIVSDTVAEFTDLDHTDSFTVEVTAVGQSVSQKVSVGANSVTVSNLVANTETTGTIHLEWESDCIPDTGWLISYTVNGTPFTASTSGDTYSATISPAIPGAEYIFSVQSADEVSTVCETLTCQTDEADDFSVNYHGNLVTKGNLSFNMCLRPAYGDWDHSDISSSSFTNHFRPDDYAGFVIYLNRRYDISSEIITAAFVILDEEENIISIDSSSQTWSSMWYRNYCELNIPSLPDTPGNYEIQVYFNGQLANIQSFVVE